MQGFAGRPEADLNSQGQEKDTEHESDGHPGAFPAPVLALVPAFFTGRDQFAKAHDRVGQPRGVANQQVEEPAGQEGKDAAHRGSSR